MTSSGIVDTGTTLLLLATDAFKAYQKATGATLDRWVIFFKIYFAIASTFWFSETGLLTVTAKQFASMKSLFFQIGSVSPQP